MAWRVTSSIVNMIRKDGVLYNCCGCTNQGISAFGCNCTGCDGADINCKDRTDCASTGCDTFHSGCFAVCPCPEPPPSTTYNVCYIPGVITNPYKIFNAVLWCEGTGINARTAIIAGEHSPGALNGDGPDPLHKVASGATWSPGGKSTITPSAESCNLGCGYKLTLHWCICGTVPAP